MSNPFLVRLPHHGSQMTGGSVQSPHQSKRFKTEMSDSKMRKNASPSAEFENTAFVCETDTSAMIRLRDRRSTSSGVENISTFGGMCDNGDQR